MLFDLVASAGADLGAVALEVPYERGQFFSPGTGGGAAITGIQPSAAGFGIDPPPPTVATGVAIKLLTVEVALADADADPPYEVSVQNIEKLGALYALGAARLANDLSGADAAAVVGGGSLMIGVPEPATLAILAMGSGLVWLRRRR
jgi:hypothetical protein